MTNAGSPTRFVVLSEARSGTSLLTDTLNTHPEITCHGEVFHPNPDWHFRGHMADWSTEKLLALRSRETEFLEQVFSQPNAAAVGFKMWRSQSLSACTKLLADDTVFKVILERTNNLSQYSSTLLANQTGVWNLNANDQKQAIKPEPLVFVPHEFRQFRAYQHDTFEFYHRNATGPVLYLTFEMLVRDGFESVQKFLKVTSMPLQSQKQRLHGSDILSRFREQDHALIRKELESIGHPEWVAE